MRTLAVWGFLGAALAQDLDHTKWKLVHDGPGVTLRFDNGRYHLKICNSISGLYKLEDGQLTGKPGASTMMACEGKVMKLEEEISKAFAAPQPFKIEGDRLTIGPRTFEREAMASKAAQTKFIYVAPETKDCTGVAPMKCLQVRENKSMPWRLHYSGIVGFQHEPGIEYRLRIKEDKVENPPADGSSVVWYLDLVVEQKKIKAGA